MSLHVNEPDKMKIKNSSQLLEWIACVHQQ